MPSQCSFPLSLGLRLRGCLCGDLNSDVMMCVRYKSMTAWCSLMSDLMFELSVPDESFGPRLLQMCNQALFEFLALNLHCLQGNQAALTSVINHRIVSTQWPSTTHGHYPATFTSHSLYPLPSRNTVHLS